MRRANATGRETGAEVSLWHYKENARVGLAHPQEVRV